MKVKWSSDIDKDTLRQFRLEGRKMQKAAERHYEPMRKGMMMRRSISTWWRFMNIIRKEK